MRVFTEPALLLALILVVAVSGEFTYFSKHLLKMIYSKTSFMRHSESLQGDNVKIKESERLFIGFEQSKM